MNRLTELALNQFTGYLLRDQGGTEKELLQSMGLSKQEWIELRDHSVFAGADRVVQIIDAEYGL